MKRVLLPAVFLLILSIILLSCGSHSYYSKRRYCSAYGHVNGRFMGHNLNTGNGGFESNPQVEKIAGLKPGTLTGGEINDFGKWKMWNDIESGELKSCSDTWKFYPSSGRYTVQVSNEDGHPLVDCPVSLLDAKGNPIWNARTDNTGKAELWEGMFDNNPVKNGIYSIRADWNGKEFTKTNVASFYNGINYLKIPASCDVSTTVDVAFVVDATGSMDDEINYLKTDLNDIISKVKLNHPAFAINTAGMFYRCVGNSFVTKQSDFSSDIKNTVDFIKANTAGEGGDEAVEIAMDEAVNKLSWSKTARTRMLFLVLDEPPGTGNNVLDKLHSAIKSAAEKGIRVIPVVCSGQGYGAEKKLEYLMRSFALATNGTYTFLTDDSGVGDSHTKPTTDSYKVEIFNELLIRLFDQNTFIPACDAPSVVIDLNRKDELKVDVVESINQKEPVVTASKDSVPPSDSLKQTSETKKFILHYYPNPCSDKLYVETDSDIGELYLADITGKLLIRFSAKLNESTMIDMHDYSSGIYFLTYISGKQAITGKIVVGH